MLKLDVLIDLFFPDLPWQARAREIAELGYNYVETWQGSNPEVLKEISSGNAKLVSIVMNFATDDEVAPIGKDNLKRFIERIDSYSDNALAAGCEQGIVTTGQSIIGGNYQEQRGALINALQKAGELVKEKGFRLMLEPLNTEVDHPGYFLNSPEEAVAIVKEVALDNVKILFDVYHMEIMRGNQSVFIENNIRHIGHFHCAGVPGRHEPFSGETNYPFIVNKIEKTGYDGYFGLEYFPELESADSLGRTLEYLRGQ